MKKELLRIFLPAILITSSVSAQTFFENFEAQPNNATTFTTNGQSFSIGNSFHIEADYPGTGWNGTANDNSYIDNTGTAAPGVDATFFVKTTNMAVFNAKSLWLYIGDFGANITTNGTLTIIGKLAGAGQFTATASSGFATGLTPSNGYTYIDFTTWGGTNNSNTAIDELLFTTVGNFEYLGLDAFSWSYPVTTSLSQNKTAANELYTYPNPFSSSFTLNTGKFTQSQLSIYSFTGELLLEKSCPSATTEIDLSEYPAGIYYVHVQSENNTFVKKIIKQ